MGLPPWKEDLREVGTCKLSQHWDPAEDTHTSCSGTPSKWPTEVAVGKCPTRWGQCGDTRALCYLMTCGGVTQRPFWEAQL